MKTLHHPHADALSLSGVLYALSDPIRFQIVQRLASEGDRACGTFGIAVGKTNMSYHFKVLREAGIIMQRVEGTQRINCLRREDLDTRFPGLLETVLRVGGVASTMPAEPETVADTALPV